PCQGRLVETNEQNKSNEQAWDHARPRYLGAIPTDGQTICAPLVARLWGGRVIWPRWGANTGDGSLLEEKDRARCPEPPVNGPLWVPAELSPEDLKFNPPIYSQRKSAETFVLATGKKSNAGSHPPVTRPSLLNREPVS